MALLIMGIIRNKKTGIYEARKKVPKHLEAAVARVLKDDKGRRSWLSKSLGTKDQKVANRVGKLVLADFDRTILKAEASLTEEPAVLAELSDQLIREMGEYFYALILEEDDTLRLEVSSSEFGKFVDGVSKQSRWNGTGTAKVTATRFKRLQDGVTEFVRPRIQQALKTNDSARL